MFIQKFFFIIVFILSLTAETYAICYPDPSCEAPITKSFSDANQVLSHNYSVIERKLNVVTSYYKEQNALLKQELAFAQMHLKLEAAIFKKLSYYQFMLQKQAKKANISIGGLTK